MTLVLELPIPVEMIGGATATASGYQVLLRGSGILKVPVSKKTYDRVVASLEAARGTSAISPVITAG